MLIVNAILYFIEDAAAITAVASVLRYAFLRELKPKKTAIAVLAALLAVNAAAGAYLATIHEFLPGLTDAISFALRAVTIKKLFKGDGGKNFLTLIFFDMTTDTLWSLASQFLPGSYAVESIFCAAISLAVIAAIKAVTAGGKLNPLSVVFEGIPKWVYAAVALFELTCYYKEFGEAVSWYTALYTVSTAAVIACIVYLALKVFTLLRKQSAILEQLKEQVSYGEKLSYDDESLRRFRHDYKNHMMVVEALLNSGRTAEAANYLNSIKRTAADAVYSVKTGNVVADAIIGNKVSSGGVPIRFEGAVPRSGVANEDLCTILANLIDNAVEAVKAQQIENPVITVAASTQGSQLCLSVENPIAFLSDDGRTSKRDKRNHGLGLKNVRSAAKKYDGFFSSDEEDGVHTARVVLNLPAENETT